MRPHPTPRDVASLIASMTDVTLGGCALALVATDSRVVHALVALALVVLLVMRLEHDA